jgi:Bacteriophage HK97-gp10, putative tail-component
VTFVLNPAAGDELAASQRCRDGLREIGEQYAAAVRAAAPVESGDYRDSVEVVDRGGVVSVVLSDLAAHLVEFGSVNNQPYAPVRRAALAIGLRLIDRYQR